MRTGWQWTQRVTIGELANAPAQMDAYMAQQQQKRRISLYEISRIGEYFTLSAQFVPAS